MKYELNIRHINTYAAQNNWLDYWNKDVLKRSLILAFVIGISLTLGNQTEAVFAAAEFAKLQLVMAFVIPFITITFSQLGAMYQADGDRSKVQLIAKPEHLLKSVVKHNIPLRAFVISMVVGSVSSVIILTNTVIQNGGIENAPWPELIQSYVLPFIFGALSQALTYRRNIAK
jgi:hypothetical protein